MNKYHPDTYLLSPQFQPIAQWWDSIVFLDKTDPSVVLKLYDPLSSDEVRRYYEMQSEISRTWWTMSDGEVDLSIMDPLNSEKFAIVENEDGVLVVLPKAPGSNLSSFWSDIQRTRIIRRVRKLMQEKGLPTTGGFEVKPENIMVSERQWWEKLIVIITDVWARVDECMREISI